MYLKDNIPESQPLASKLSNASLKTESSFSDSISSSSSIGEFKQIILHLIMHTRISVSNMSNSRRSLCQVLVERNFLRWEADDDEEDVGNGVTIMNGEELVWYSRLVRDVCEEWFHTSEQ
jgi:hypothetical protein